MANKKMLFVIGAVFPLHSTNANIMCKLIEKLSERNSVTVLSIGQYSDDDTEPIRIGKAEVIKYSSQSHRIITKGYKNIGAFCKTLYRAIDRIFDHGGYHELRDALTVSHFIRKLCAEYKFETAVFCTEPFASALALSLSKLKLKKCLYLIDPPSEIVRGMETAGTPLRKRSTKKILKSTDLLLTTDRIALALAEHGFDRYIRKTETIEFPLFSLEEQVFGHSEIEFNNEKINLLYCGWLRSEAALVKILNGLSEEYCVTFIGNGTERIAGVKTDAEIRTYKSINRQCALKAIADADILVCIGNPYPVHIPSKVFDYISSGKPILNIYNIEDCPTLHYLKYYPLAMNVFSEDADEKNTAIQEFCQSAKGQSVDINSLYELYKSIDAQTIVKRLCEAIENL